MPGKTPGMHKIKNGFRQRGHKRRIVLPVIGMPAEASAELWIRLTAPALVPVYDVRIGIGYNLLSRIKIILEADIGKPFQLHTVNIPHTVFFRKRQMHRLARRMQI